MSCKIDESAKRKIVGYFGRSLKDLDSDVKLIKNWLKNQRDLPETPSTNMIEYFLVNNKFSIETTKEKLHMYYTVRNLIPNLFKIINPRTSRMKESFNMQYVFPLPKLINGLYRVLLVRLKQIPGYKWDPECFIGHVLNMFEIRMQEDLMFDDIVVLDYLHLTLGHVLNVTLNHAKVCQTILEKVYSNRVREVHIVNHPLVFNLLFKLATAVLDESIHKKIHFHNTIEALKYYIPSDVLPKEYGGSEKSLDELEEAWSEKLKEYQYRFDQLDELLI